MGRRSRRKGQNWERTIARIMRAVFGEEVHRGHQTARGGAAPGEGCDVDGTPWWIEAKHRWTVGVSEALRQAVDVSARKHDARPPVVIAKTDRPPPGWTVGKPLDPPTATMRFSDWLALVEDWAQLRRRLGLPVVAPVGDKRLREFRTAAASDGAD